MSRRIEAPRAKLGKKEGGENYAGRLVKYIPAEIVALYIGAKGIPPANSPQRDQALWIIFWLCLILTPIYLAVVTRDKKAKKGPLWLQVLLATIAFPIWVFAIGNGPFDVYHVEAWISSLVLLFVTFIFGLVPVPAE